MADDPCHIGIDQFLRHRGAGLRISLIVLGEEHELHFLAVDLDPGCVRLLDREARAVLVVLAKMGDAAGERPDVADADLDSRRGGRYLRLFGLDRGFLFAAAGERHRGSNEGNAELHVVHGFSSLGADIIPRQIEQKKARHGLPGLAQLAGPERLARSPAAVPRCKGRGRVRGGRVRSCGARLSRWMIYLGHGPG